MLTFKQFLLEDMTNPKFRKWARGTKVKNEDGTPRIVYHGSGTMIEEFSYEFTNQGNDQLGSGFYFSTDIAEAEGYAKTTPSSQPKLGGSDIPTVHPCYLKLLNPLDADKIGNIKYDKIRFLISRAPDLLDSLSNWGDIGSENKESILHRAAKNYIIDHENIVQGLFDVANDFYPDDVEKFNRIIYTTLGYDGVFKKHSNGTIHYVAFFPEQIKHIENVGTWNSESRKIRESLTNDYPLAPSSDWYGDSNYKETGGKLVYMSPEEFLSKCRPLEIDDSSRDNIDSLKDHIDSGRTLDPLLLDYIHLIPNDKPKEDGRHRAYAAKELGITKVPVIVFK